MFFFYCKWEERRYEPNSGKQFQNLTHIITEDHISFHHTYPKWNEDVWTVYINTAKFISRVLWNVLLYLPVQKPTAFQV